MTLGEDEVQLFRGQDDSPPQCRVEVASSCVPVPVGPDQTSPPLLLMGEQPLVGQLSECSSRFFPCPSSFFPIAKLSGPELLPVDGEAQVRIQQLPTKGEEVHGVWVAGDAHHLPEGGASVVGVWLARVYPVEDGDDGPRLCS